MMRIVYSIPVILLCVFGLTVSGGLAANDTEVQEVEIAIKTLSKQISRLQKKLSGLQMRRKSLLAGSSDKCEKLWAALVKKGRQCEPDPEESDAVEMCMQKHKVKEYRMMVDSKCETQKNMLWEIEFARQKWPKVPKQK